MDKIISNNDVSLGTDAIIKNPVAPPEDPNHALYSARTGRTTSTGLRSDIEDNGGSDSGGRSTTNTTTNTTNDTTSDSTETSESSNRGTLRNGEEDSSSTTSWQELVQNILNGGDSSILSDWSSMADALKEIYQGLYKNGMSLDESERKNLAECLFNNIYNLALQTYNSQNELALWEYQQSYNSPEEQLKRLEEAGLAGMFSSVSSNTAESSASYDTGTQSSLSNMGNLAAQKSQRRQARWQMALQGIQQAATLGMQGAQLPSQIQQSKAAIALDKAQSYNIENMTPYQRRLTAAQCAFTEQQADNYYEVSRSQIASNYALTDKARNDIETAWANLEQQYDLACKGFDVTRETAQLSSDTSIKTANIGAAASRYSADVSADTQNGLDYDETGYQEVGANGELTGSISLGLPKGVSIGADGKISGNGRTYKQITFKRHMSAKEFFQRKKESYQFDYHKKGNFANIANAYEDIETTAKYVNKESAKKLASSVKKSIDLHQGAVLDKDYSQESIGFSNRSW